MKKILIKEKINTTLIIFVKNILKKIKMARFKKMIQLMNIQNIVKKIKLKMKEIK